TVVTAQDGTTTGTYTLTVTRVASSTATLSNLTLSSGTLAPAFISSTTSYAASVTNATASITVTPTATDPTSTITVNGTAVVSGTASGPIPLVIGSNLVTVVVTAQDGSTTGTYTVTVDRPALTSVVLNNLTISTGSLAPAFDSQVFSYASAVGNAITSLTVTATTSDATATLTINGVPTGSGNPSNPINLQVGANVITVVVTAQGGLSTTYTVTVARASSSDALLTNLVLSDGTLTPTFGSGVNNYTSSVDNGTSEITVTPTAEDVNATIKVNGILVNSGSPSGLINLPLDDNTITVVVTAEDGTTTQTYTVIVHRSANQTAVIANNILTPNGDGKNDIWMVKNILLFPNNTVTVFDHSGRVIYTKKGYTNDWDGTYHGAPLNEDTYYYVIDLGSGARTVKGFITVIKGR
ncbi:MAG TPA: cadherin-like beta sandwich domain-containing protein, partial [Mucilaginibacter sp.]